MKAPKFFLYSYKDWFASINLLLFLATLSNKKIAEFFNKQWQGVSPWWSLVFIVILVSWSIMLAIYERDKEIYLAYKTANDIIEESQDYNFMSLKKACDRLNKSIGIRIASLDTYGIYNKLGKYFVAVDDIYGKSPSPQFNDWVVIPKYKINSGTIMIEQGELVLYTSGGIYIDNILEYINIAIKKDKLIEDIDKIMLEMA